MSMAPDIPTFSDPEHLPRADHHHVNDHGEQQAEPPDDFLLAPLTPSPSIIR